MAKTNHQGEIATPNCKMAKKVELVASWEEEDHRGGFIIQNKIILINGKILVKITKRTPPAVDLSDFYEAKGFPRGYEPPWNSEDECKEIVGLDTDLDQVTDKETLEDVETHLRDLARWDQQEQ